MIKALRNILPAIMMGVSSFSFAYTQTVSSVYEANTMCSFPFSCDSEQIAPDNRPSLNIVQPTAPDVVKGNCSTIHPAFSYMARPLALTCGTAETVRVRGMIDHPQEKLDSNLEILNTGDRVRAQKVLLTDFKWENPLKFSVKENWVFKRKTGAYINCAGRFGAEGGAVEQYQTTCYRTGRKEKVVQRIVTHHKYCARATPPPPPPPEPSPAPQTSGGGYTGGGYTGGGYTGSGSTSGGSSGSGSQRRESRPDPKPQPKGDRESGRSDRLRRGFDKGSSIIEYFKADYRSPAQNGGMRRIEGIERTEVGSTPMYGCDRWDYSKDTWEDVYSYVDAPDLAYTCTKTRNQWCTWFEDETASQMCPEQKTANVTVQYVTPADWNPSNPNYDDQLPNKHDLLLGESELVKISANTNISNVMTPSIQFGNAVVDSFGRVRPKTWNEYKPEISPARLNCEYKDQNITIKVHTLGRNVQAAPNPLVVPKDENGNDIALSGVDSRGRPSLLTMINPGRNMVLDRSNISRIFGDSTASGDAKMNSQTVTAEKNKSQGGITQKFWENTKFHMRLLWWDGKNCTQDPSKCKEVRVTQARPFSLNQAGPVGDSLEVSLEGKGGMEKFYKIAMPYEDIFGFLGGDFALDPKKDYYLEIKLAQPYFKGIYLDGQAANTSGGEADIKSENKNAKVNNKEAYSEAKYILLRAPESKRSLLDMFWHWRSSRTWRP